MAKRCAGNEVVQVRDLCSLRVATFQNFSIIRLMMPPQNFLYLKRVLVRDFYESTYVNQRQK